MKRIQSFMRNSILLTIIAFVGYCLYQSFFLLGNGKILQQGSADYVALTIALSIVGMVIIMLLFKQITKFTPRQELVFQIIVSVIIVGVQFVVMYFVYKEHVLPSTDLATNTDEAIKLMQNGLFAENSSASVYPFNRTHILILYYYYKILTRVGITAYWEASIPLAMVCIDAAIVFTQLCMREVRGRKAELLLLVFVGLNPITYLCLPYYYTSITSMPFFMGSLYFGIKLIKCKSPKSGMIYALLAGFTGAMGFKIRGTALFALIAMVVWVICRTKQERFDKQRLKNIFAKIAVLCVTIALTWNTWDGVVGKYDKYDRSDSAFPTTHSIMMSLQGQGGFVQSDVDYTSKFATKEEKEEANISVIKQRLEKLGIAGYISLVGEKIKFNWAEGYARLTNWYPATMRYISGSGRDILMLYSQIVRIITWGFILIAVVSKFRKKIWDISCIPLIIMLGAFVIHVFIECNPQYSVPFLLVMALAACDGIDIVKGQYVVSTYENRNQSAKLARTGCAIAALVIMVTGIEYYQAYTQYQRNETAYVRGNSYKNTMEPDVVSQSRTISQDFQTDQTFNCISVGVSVIDGTQADTRYEFVLYDNDDNTIFQQDFGVEDIEDGSRYITFNVGNIPNETLRRYRLSISGISGSSDSLAFAAENRMLDYATDGELVIDSQVSENADLTYLVVCNYVGTIMSRELYCAIIVIMLGVVGVMIAILHYSKE